MQARVQNTVRRVAGATITPGVQIGRVCRILEQFHCDLTGIRIAQLEPVRWIGRRLMLVGTFSLVAWIVVPPFARSIVAARQIEVDRGRARGRASPSGRLARTAVPIERADLEQRPRLASRRSVLPLRSGRAEWHRRRNSIARSRTASTSRSKYGGAEPHGEVAATRCCAPSGSAPIACNSSSASAATGARGFPFTTMKVVEPARARRASTSGRQLRVLGGIRMGRRRAEIPGDAIETDAGPRLELARSRRDEGGAARARGRTSGCWRYSSRIGTTRPRISGWSVCLARATPEALCRDPSR